jgi:hypothetical protein
MINWVNLLDTSTSACNVNQHRSDPRTLSRAYCQTTIIFPRIVVGATELEWSNSRVHAGVETGPARRSVVTAACVGVAVSVLIWLTLSYIVWCIRNGNGERLFRRRGFFLK